MPNTRKSKPRRPTPRVPARLTSLLRLSAPLVLLALLPIAVPGLMAESADQAQPPQQPPQQAAADAPCSVAGMVAAGQARLPGVIVSVTAGRGRRGAHDVDGSRRPLPCDDSGPGRFVVKAELAAFATVTKDVAAEAPCQARLDIVMTLASRVRASTPSAPRGGIGRPGARRSRPPVRPQRPGSRAAGSGSGHAGRRPPRPGLRVSSSVSVRRSRAPTGPDEELTVTTEDTRALAEGLNCRRALRPRR